MYTYTRRHFLQAAAASGLATVWPWHAATAASYKAPLYKISLAEWSLHRSIRAGKLDHLDFAKTAKQEFEIDAVEYVNQFFMDKARDKSYLSQMKQNAADAGVQSLLIMIDREGNLGDPNEKKRKQAVENHHKWVEAAKFLGCHSIRVNARSGGSYEEQRDRAADGLRQLTEFADPYEINVIVENHGGLSSNGRWLAAVMKKVGHKRCGTLPDFGNFAIDRQRDIWYDRYEGVQELMPYAKAVSAKSYDFGQAGNDTRTDYLRIMKIVVDSGYHGYVGIEYEGGKLDEFAGIRATKALLEHVREKLSA